MRRWVGSSWLVLLAACSEAESDRSDVAPSPIDAASDAGASIDAAHPPDDGSIPVEHDAGPPAPDAAPRDAAVDPPDVVSGPTDAESFDAGPAPSSALRPVPGELTVVQLDLPPGPTFRLGESAIVVGPSGSVVLLDVGNSSHDDDVRARLQEVNRHLGRPDGQVDWIILTHFHGDHVGAMADLFSGNNPLSVTGGVVYRGFVDLGEGMNTNDYAEVCDLLRGPLASQARPLCVSASAPPCRWASGDDPVLASGCPGLAEGDLSAASDDASGLPAYFDLDGARVSFSAANGWVYDGREARFMRFGHEDGNEENGRSLVGQISYGPFTYHFGGDLTGSGEATEPDVESFWATHAGAEIYGTLGADVIHAHHHARRTSSNTVLIDLLAPLDGRSRNVVAGINQMYVGSPATEVVTAWTGRGRLGRGAFWVTEIAPGGDSSSASADLVAADGEVIIQTFGAGAGYWVQASGPALHTRGFSSLR